jgi:hypothetical protein
VAVSPVLRAKHAFYEGDVRGAVSTLEEILGERALYVSDEVASSRAGLPFESFLTGLLADPHHLMVPFEQAIGRMWSAFPAQYAIQALTLREQFAGDAEEAASALLEEAARDGLLTSRPDRVAQVTPPEGRAAADGDYRSWVTAHPDLVASLLLDAVFYRARVVDRSMALDRLDRVADEQPELLEPAADALAEWDPEIVARVGMRVSDPACAAMLVEVLRSGDFDALPEGCV